MYEPGKFQDDIDKARELQHEQPTPRAGRNGNVPPKEFQFKPGQSGNPSGRPKRIFSSLVHAYLEMDDRKLARKFIRQLFEQACKGNRAAMHLIVSRLDRLDALPPGAALEPSDVEAHAQAFESEKQESQTGKFQEGRVVIVIPDNGRDPELTKQYIEQQERRERES